MGEAIPFELQVALATMAAKPLADVADAQPVVVVVVVVAVVVVDVVCVFLVNVVVRGDACGGCVVDTVVLGVSDQHLRIKIVDLSDVDLFLGNTA